MGIWRINFFVPCCYLAVLALFTHLGCAVYWQLQQASPCALGLAIGLPMLIGGTIALLIVLSLAGKIQPVEIPAKYLSTFSSSSD